MYHLIKLNFKFAMSSRVAVFPSLSSILPSTALTFSGPK